MRRDPLTTLAASGLQTDRRTLIQAGAVAAVFSGVGLAKARATTPTIYKAVFDQRYEDGLRFGREAARMGLATAAIDGDVTALWYHDLHHRWRKGPAPLVGLTDSAALFCLETLANDAGMRVVFRSHYRGGDEDLTHHLAGDAAMIAAAQSLPSGTASAPALARLVAACPSLAAPGTAGRSAAACQAPTRAARHLTAWAIAPVKRA